MDYIYTLDDFIQSINTVYATKFNTKNIIHNFPHVSEQFKNRDNLKQKNILRVRTVSGLLDIYEREYMLQNYNIKLRVTYSEFDNGIVMVNVIKK